VTENNHNLIVRVVTALVLLPLIIWLIWQGGLAFALLISFAAAGCAIELNLLPGQAASSPALEAVTPKEHRKVAGVVREEIEEIETTSATLSGGAVVSIGAAFALPLLDEIQVSFLSFKLVLAAVVIVALVDALLFETDVARAPVRVGLAVLGAAYPGLLLSALVRIRQLDRGEWWIILTLVVTWWNDTGAYFAGRAFGRTPLYPRISPSKTWEGAVGGALLATVGALLVQRFWLSDLLPWWAAVVISLGASVFGPLGDLSESMLKRAFGTKDSGRLLPGHGGMLDRIDALMFTAPFVLLCARLFAGRG
jgi:phosphatidate cytidylyltransferase